MPGPYRLGLPVWAHPGWRGGLFRRKARPDAFLGQYAAAFESAGYDDADSLAALTEEDLGEIAAFARITIPPGHRKKLLLASRTWRAEARSEAGAAGPSDRPPEPRASPSSTCHQSTHWMV